MVFKAEIIKDVSYDPYYKVRFFYEADGIIVDKGYAEIIRKSPRPQISYDSITERKFQATDKSKLELELLNLVICDLLSKKQ